MIPDKEGKCSICGDPGKRMAYTISGNVWYACPKHEKDVAKISAERHGKSQVERAQTQRLHELLDIKSKKFM